MLTLLPYPVSALLAGAFLGLLVIALMLNIFGLPGNWLILGLDFVWTLLLPDARASGWLFWGGLIFLALLGEVLETGVQILKARKYGSSSSGTFGGMVGAIIGSIALAPLFWGIGALIGALAGAWLGCWLMELRKGKSGEQARSAAFGTMVGRFLGTVCKIGTGAAMIALTAHAIWPETAAQPVAPDGTLTACALALAG